MAKDVATNRNARFKYELLDKWEAGMQLTGTEVKSLRDAQVDLKDSYVDLRDGEVWLVGAYIAPYPPAAMTNHDPERQRKLLLNRYEIERLVGKTKESGLTVVPVRIYFKNGRAKVEIALAKGKKAHDKRQAIKERESKREMQRALKEKYR